MPCLFSNLRGANIYGFKHKSEGMNTEKLAKVQLKIVFQGFQIGRMQYIFAGKF